MQPIFVGLVQSIHLLGPPIQPTHDIWLPGQFLREHVDHTASGDSGWRGDLQIHDFEEHVHCRVQLNTFTIGQAEHHVVVEDCVHVLDPEGVDWAIKNYPICHVWVLFVDALSHDGRG
jgi:hypothetical protein